MNWERRCRRATAALLDAAREGLFVSLELVRQTGMPRDTLGMLLAFPPAVRPLVLADDDGSTPVVPAAVILARLDRAKQIERDGVDPVSGLTTEELAHLFARAGEAGRRLEGLA